jgi:hypothetical protein
MFSNGRCLMCPVGDLKGLIPLANNILAHHMAYNFCWSLGDNTSPIPCRSVVFKLR